MVQNHLMQLLCMIAMEPPVTYRADEIQIRKIDVLNAVRPYDRPEKVQRNTVRGQYGEGTIDGEKINAYRETINVRPDSGTERSEEHTSELQSRGHLVCRLLLE